jgi:hypothetical protein
MHWYSFALAIMAEAIVRSAQTLVYNAAKPVFVDTSAARAENLSDKPNNL